MEDNSRLVNSQRLLSILKYKSRRAEPNLTYEALNANYFFYTGMSFQDFVCVKWIRHNNEWKDQAEAEISSRVQKNLLSYFKKK
jgi:hypothetical protein